MKSTKTILLILVVAVFAQMLAADTLDKLYVIGQEQSLYAEPQLVVYSLDREQILKRLPTFTGADAAWLNADATEIWVVAKASGTCNIVNTTTDEVVSTVEFGARISQIAFTPDGKLCLAAGPSLRQSSGTTVQVFKCSDYQLVTSYELPAKVSDLLVSNDSQYLFYTDVKAELIGRVRLSDFERDGTQFVGFEPIQMVPVESGAEILVLSRGLDNGSRGGGQITVVAADALKPLWVVDGLGAGPTSLALNQDATQAILTFGDQGSTLDYNVGLYDLSLGSDDVRLKLQQKWLLNGEPEAGLMKPNGSLWLGIDRQKNRLIRVDLKSNQQLQPAPGLVNFETKDIRQLSFDVDARLASLPSAVQVSDSTQVAALLLGKSYLQVCAGRENDAVATCQDIVDKYPDSREAVVARLRLAKIAAANRLYSKAAEQTEDALLHYRTLLEDENFADPLPGSDLSPALERLALYDAQFDKKTTKEVAEAFLKLGDPGRGSARFYFELGRHLQTLDESKLAEKCFSVARLGLVNEPEYVDRILSSQLTLALRDKSAVYEIESRGDKIVLDGDLSDWDKVKPLELNGPKDLIYGQLDWLDEADLDADLYLTRSKENLYVAGRIVDATPAKIDDQTRDKVNVYFDMRQSASSYSTRETGIGPGCFTLTVNSPTRTTPKASVTLSQATQYQIASTKTDSGWVFEISLPLTWFGAYLPDTKHDFGLGVEVVDIDSENAGSVISALGFLQPRVSPEGGLRPQLYGIGRFK